MQGRTGSAGLVHLCRAAPEPAAAKEPAEPLRSKPPAGPPHPLPSLPVPAAPPPSCCGSGHREQLRVSKRCPPGREAKRCRGAGEGATASEEAGGGQRDPRAGSPGWGRGQRSGRLPPSSSAPPLPLPQLGKAKGGLSQVPPPCPVPRRGVKSRVFPGITILL